MGHYFICENPKCRFILDRQINGKSLDNADSVVKKCPACGGNWSSTCPSCSLTLTVKLVGGLPRTACCERKLPAKAGRVNYIPPLMNRHQTPSIREMQELVRFAVR